MFSHQGITQLLVVVDLAVAYGNYRSVLGEYRLVAMYNIHYRQPSYTKTHPIIDPNP